MIVLRSGWDGRGARDALNRFKAQQTKTSHETAFSGFIYQPGGVESPSNELED